MKRVARPDAGQHAIVVEPVLGVIQVELAVLGVAVRILPIVRKTICTTAL